MTAQARESMVMTAREPSGWFVIEATVNADGERTTRVLDGPHASEGEADQRARVIATDRGEEEAALKLPPKKQHRTSKAQCRQMTAWMKARTE